MTRAASAAGISFNPPASLPPDHVERLPAFPFRERLPHANDGGEPGGEGGPDLPVHRVVRFREILPPLGVADDAVRRPGLHQHPGRHLAGERPLVREVDVLGRHPDAASPDELRHRPDRRVRRGEDDLDPPDARHQRQEGPYEGRGFRRGLVHLPVAGDDRDAHRVTSPWRRTSPGRPGGRSTPTRCRTRRAPSPSSRRSPWSRGRRSRTRPGRG